MANDVVGMIRNLTRGVTPIVVGLILVQNQTLIPFVAPVLHQTVGWAMAVVGTLDLINWGK